MTNVTLDTKDLEERVKRMYRDVAVHPEQEFHFETGRALAERLGYPPAELDAIPGGAIESFAGVGYFLDLAAIGAGETVVDLGSGSGMDSLLAARHAGDSGRVIGVDVTDEQLDKSTRLAAEAGVRNVEFRRAYIEEAPVADGSADVVISNGVFNLAPDKDAVFREVARLLRPGGRLALADIVSDSRLPDGIKCDAALWASCIGGAMQIDGYRAAIEQAGLAIETVRTNDQYRFLSDSAVGASEEWGVKSISLLARKA
ncbi:MAG: methyltransferase domain-containing protein [bacterium]